MSVLKAASSGSRLALAIVVSLLALGGSAGKASPASVASVRLLAQFKPGISSKLVNRLIAGAGARQSAVVRGLGVRVLTVPSANADHALAVFRHSAAVRFAERDAVLEPQDNLPSDPSFPSGNFAVAGGAWGWTKTRTTQAWDVTTGSSSVVIAILDTGLKTQGLSDFDGQVVTGWNVLNGTTDTATNAGNHGTYVAGVVGLAFGNGVGNVGYCPGCRIMPVQVGTDSGAYVSDMAGGLTWAADHGAKVANLSWAGAAPSATLDSAVAYARSKGVVVVAAAGNSNCDCTNYPAASPGVLGIAGTDSADNKQSDSNYGSWVALAAPESNITAWPILNGSPGYAAVGGTSLAAPVVAGIAGLLFSADPAATGAQVEQALEASAAPVAFTVAYGRVDALGALSYLGYSDPQQPQMPTSTSPPQMLVETNGDYNSVPLSGAPQVGQVLLRGQGSWTGSAPLTLSSVQWLRCDASGANCAVAATDATYTVQPTDAGATLELAVTVANSAGSTTSTTSPSQPVGSGSAPPANTAPPVVSGSAQVGQTLTASTGSWSALPTSYAYEWQRCDPGGGACASISGATASSYAVQSADAGSTLRVGVTATNGAGSGTAYSAATSIVTSPPPANTAPPAISGTAQVGQTLTASNGSWTGSPTSYAYQWQRCDSSGANCAAISAASASSYTAQSADAAYTLRVAVTASNAGGSSTAISAATGIVASAPPPAPSTQTVTFSGVLTPSKPSLTFSLAVGTGPSTAKLTFAKCTALNLSISSGGATIAAATGGSPVGLAPILSAGTYAYTISGGKCSFTLTVTAVSP